MAKAADVKAPKLLAESFDADDEGWLDKLIADEDEPPGREIRDPATQKVIRRIEDSLGTVKITEVEEGSSVGKFTGAGTVKVGDTVSTIK